MAVAIFIGIIGYSMSLAGEIPMLDSSSSESETIIMKIADLMSQNGFLFAVVAGVILAGILAATMSTADSQLLAAASSVSEDFLQDFMRVKLTAAGQMIAARADSRRRRRRRHYPGLESPTALSSVSSPLHGRASARPSVPPCCWPSSGAGPTARERSRV